ncbi:MAG: hypothetical protein CFE46_11775 [Burkholderiales bacterium PBB6]|nr:MAG: hypothetical protein CFE46_11775 [Burkholderiales bacterium PBB6]
MLIATATGPVAAAPAPAPIKAEIDALMSRLQSSGCQFDRNGSWYTGTEAVSHILRKLDYIEGRGTLQSTEQFIEQAASKSSSSGKPYHVKCGSDAALDSQVWLQRQLGVIRAAAAAKPKP